MVGEGEATVRSSENLSRSNSVAGSILGGQAGGAAGLGVGLSEAQLGLARRRAIAKASGAGLLGRQRDLVFLASISVKRSRERSLRRHPCPAAFNVSGTSIQKPWSIPGHAGLAGNTGSALLSMPDPRPNSRLTRFFRLTSRSDSCGLA